MAALVFEFGDPVLRSDWHTEDIRSMDDSLTEDQVIRVMLLIARTHDACIGINWDVIDQAITHIKEDDGWK